MRRAGRSPLRWLLMLIGLMLLLMAVWGLYRNFPDFATLRAEPARLELPAPTASGTPSVTP